LVLLLTRLRTFLPDCGLRHKEFAKALSRADLLGSFALCLLAARAFSFVRLFRPSFALNLTYVAVKPPNFMFLKAVSAAKNASLPLFARN